MVCSIHHYMKFVESKRVVRAIKNFYFITSFMAFQFLFLILSLLFLILNFIPNFFYKLLIWTVTSTRPTFM